jgi:hypothetical protein
MNIHVNKELSKIMVKGRLIPCSCDVRNELNGRRKGYDVVYSEPDKVPYMPRVFPSGIWTISQPRARIDKYLAPYYIPSDAWQYVDEWLIDAGRYDKPSGVKVKDHAYGLHFSESRTTLGCIKILYLADLLWLVDEIKTALKDNEVKLIVEA